MSTRVASMNMTSGAGSTRVPLAGYVPRLAKRSALETCLQGCTLPRVIPWIIIAIVAVPLVVVGYMAMRRNTAASELPASDSADSKALTEQEFAEAEAYEAKWHEDDKERYHQERLP